MIALSRSRVEPLICDSLPHLNTVCTWLVSRTGLPIGPSRDHNSGASRWISCLDGSRVFSVSNSINIFLGQHSIKRYGIPGDIAIWWYRLTSELMLPGKPVRSRIVVNCLFVNEVSESILEAPFCSQTLSFFATCSNANCCQWHWTFCKTGCDVLMSIISRPLSNATAMCSMCSSLIGAFPAAVA